MTPDTLRTVLAALGYPANSNSDILESQQRLDCEARALPPLITALPGEFVHVEHAKLARLKTQKGEWKEIPLQPQKNGGSSVRAPETMPREIDDIRRGPLHPSYNCAGSPLMPAVEADWPTD